MLGGIEREWNSFLNKDMRQAYEKLAAFVNEYDLDYVGNKQ